jgi:uncharacterized sulfatase
MPCVRHGSVAILLWSGLVGTLLAADAPARPNVILIVADDLGYGDLQCYGHPRFKTPHLDRMAREGVRFTNFTVPVPYCAPSRGTFLTGRYPWRHGVIQNPTPDAGINDVGLPASEITLGEQFKIAGYATSCIGKWHLGHKPEFSPTRHGFDEYLGILYSNDMRPVQLIDGEAVVEYPVVQALLTKKYTERALKFIEQQRERPFFLYLPHAMPHKPLAPAEKYYKQSGAGLYGDVMAELDWSIGEILAKLRELQLDEKTLVLFTSDNGPWFGGSTGGLRGMKGQTWEGGLRVPLIARWPSRIPADRVLHDVCSSSDIFPTVLEAAGIEAPTDRVIDGRSLLPLLTGKGPYSARPIFAMLGANLMTVREGRWKLHVRMPGTPGFLRDPDHWVDPRGPDGVTLLAPYEQSAPKEFPGIRTGDEPKQLMLCDLESDPSEQHDVAAEHPDVVQRLRKAFDEMQAEFPRKPAPAK